MIDNTDLIYCFKAKKLHLTSKEPIPWTRDGEFGGIHDEVHIENLNKAIQMCVNNNDN
jgi:diacylglycerol kinase family enzyme